MKIMDALDRQLKRAAKKALIQPESAAACLDPEILAAWTDGELPARERARAEAHAAECARCQELLAALVRTVPDARPTGLEQAGIWRQRRFWLSRPEWVVPIAAAACIVLAVATGLVLHNPMKPAAVPAAVERGKVVEEPRQETARAQSALPREETAPATPAKQPARTPEGAAEKVQTLDRLRRDEGERSARFAGSRALPEPPPPASASVATPPPSSSSSGAMARERLADKVEEAKKGTQPNPSEPPGELRAEAQSTREADVARGARGATSAATPAPLFRAAAPLKSNRDIVSTDSKIRWRIVSDSPGAVQRSADSGQTWETLRTGAPVILRAGASPSPAVCWLVGGNGVVVVTTDGRVWRRVDVPAAGDLVGITALDDKTATVKAADGRSYQTTDGGKSWKDL